MMWKKQIITTTVALCLLAAPFQSATAAADQATTDTLKEVFTLLVDNHYSHPDQEKVLQGAIQGMLNTLNDPYTNYMTPTEYQEFVDAVNQSYAGIGVQFDTQAMIDSLPVSKVFAGSPAEKAGLQPGDQVVKVGDQEVTVENASSMPTKIRGKAGTPVLLTVLRHDQVLTLQVTRAAIDLPMVESSDLGNGIGYIHINSFGERTDTDFQRAWTQLQQTSEKGLILDVRGNGGGLVQSALTIVDEFLTKGAILILHDENGRAVELAADAAGNEQVPLAVLIDGNSASASEMLAGALQQNGRAKLVGAQSFGKGTMQSPVTLPNGGHLKVSIDRWELGDGSSPDLIGLSPDLSITNDALVTNAAVQLLLPSRAQSLTLNRTNDRGSLNGIELTRQPGVQEQNGQLYLPLRFTVEAFGEQVDWLGAEHAVTFTLNGHAVRVNADRTLWIDNKSIGLVDAVQHVNGSLYLSAQAVQKLTSSISITPQAVTITIN